MGMPWDLGLNTCGPATEERLLTLIRTGFKCAYLGGPVLTPEHFDASRANVLRFTDVLPPWSVHLPIIFRGWDMDEQAVTDELLGLLARAGAFGVSNATLHVPCYARWLGRDPDWDGVAEHRAVVMRVIRRGAAQANELGFRLNLENGSHPGISVAQPCCGHDSESLRQYLDELQASGVGVCLDTGHSLLSGQDPAQMIRDLGPLLQETHFNDNCGVVTPEAPDKSDFHRPPGIGKIDWLAVMDALEEIDYPHPVVFEEGMVQVGGDTFEYMARATFENWRAFERVRARRDGRDPVELDTGQCVPGD